MIGRTPLELNCWVEPELRQDRAQRVLRDSSFRDRLARYRRKDGQLILAQISASMIEIAGVTCLRRLPPPAQTGSLVCGSGQLQKPQRYPLGHQTDDLLLQEAANRLRFCIRETDTVARLGGDEFLIMLNDLSATPEDAAAQAKLVAEKVLASLEKPYWLDGRQCLRSASH